MPDALVSRRPEAEPEKKSNPLRKAISQQAGATTLEGRSKPAIPIKIAAIGSRARTK